MAQAFALFQVEEVVTSCVLLPKVACAVNCTGLPSPMSLKVTGSGLMVKESGEFTKKFLQLIAPANRKSIETAASARNFLLLFNIFGNHQKTQSRVNVSQAMR